MFLACNDHHYYDTSTTNPAKHTDNNQTKLLLLVEFANGLDRKQRIVIQGKQPPMAKDKPNDKSVTFCMLSIYLFFLLKCDKFITIDLQYLQIVIF